MRRIVIFVVSILLCLSVYSDYQYFSSHKETVGIIREIKYTDKHTVVSPNNVKSRVVYEVDGIQYNGFTNSWNGTFKVNKEIPIFYDIENPSNFNYVYQINSVSFVTLFLLIVLFFSCFIRVPKCLNRLFKEKDIIYT